MSADFRNPAKAHHTERAKPTPRSTQCEWCEEPKASYYSNYCTKHSLEARRAPKIFDPPEYGDAELEAMLDELIEETERTKWRMMK